MKRWSIGQKNCDSKWSMDPLVTNTPVATCLIAKWPSTGRRNSLLPPSSLCPSFFLAHHVCISSPCDIKPRNPHVYGCSIFVYACVSVCVCVCAHAQRVCICTSRASLGRHWWRMYGHMQGRLSVYIRTRGGGSMSLGIGARKWRTQARGIAWNFGSRRIQR